MRDGRSGRGWRPRRRGPLVALAVLTTAFMWQDGPASPAAADGDETPDCGGTRCRFSHAPTYVRQFTQAYDGGSSSPRFVDAYTELTAVGDITRDGIGDLVAVRRSDGCLGRWRGDRNGGLDYAGDVGCGWDSYAELAGVGDITRDGIGDLVGVRSADGCIARWRGTGNGGFEYFGDYGCVWKAYTDLT